MFFSDFGSLIHSLLADFHSGKLTRDQAITRYLMRFPSEVRGRAPNQEIRASYFNQGLECVKNFSPIAGQILGVEQFVHFKIDELPFIGFVDLIYEDEDGALCILDHKSRALKPRSKRKKPTKTDEELDAYLRQLYLYSIPIAAKYGRYPDFLEFNCYRSGERIKECFHLEALEATKKWALDTIQQIREEKEWKPNLDYWVCSNICGLSSSCEYKGCCNDWK